MRSSATNSRRAEQENVGVSPQLIAFRDELRGVGRKVICQLKRNGYTVSLHTGRQACWGIITWPSGARLAVCLTYAPGDGIQIEEQQGDENEIRITVTSSIGRFHIDIDLHGGAIPILHWRTALMPNEPLTPSFWPSELYPLDERGDPLGTHGVVHTKQRGNRAALLYASMTRPQPGSFLAIQNLTALNDYFEQTQTSPSDRVSDRWPELGFSLPPAPTKQLAAGRETVLSDTYIALSPTVPQNDRKEAQQFLDLYGALYLAWPRPEAEHRDWPRRVDQTIRDITHSPLCTVEHEGERYLLAYLGADDRPPESMVQLAVLVPMIEYSRAREQTIPLIEPLRRAIPTFLDPRIGSLVRWLPAMKSLLKGKEEQMGEEVMDSWYLYHTLLNLARLARNKDRETRRLFIESVEYGIHVAHRFDYRWPIFYDLFSLETIKAESAPGRGGEHDVAAQYVHIMQHAWELTGDDRYIEEAERAAEKLIGLGFKLGYQFNNTSFGAGALLWLWRQTGRALYRDLAEVCMANIVGNFWLWQCKYGHARHYHTFMGLPPLQDAPYLALYEELEVLAAFHEYLAIAGEDARPALRVLLPEYCKYLIDRAWYHYPSELPADILAEKPTSGCLDRYISIPLEDVRDGWERAGQVGQEIYGAAAPFVFATRHCHTIPGLGFTVHCNYPVRDLVISKNRGSGHVSFDVLGDRRCTCHIRIVPESYVPLPTLQLRFKGRTGWKECQGELMKYGYLEFALPGNASVEVRWQNADSRSSSKTARHNGNGRRSTTERKRSTQRTR